MGIDAGSLVHLMSLYGYPLLAAILFIGSAGAPLPLGVALVLLGALSVGHGGPDFLLLTLTGIAASVAGDLADYTAGRIGGARLLHWLYAHQRRLMGPPLVQANRLLRRHGGIVIFLSRFLLTAVSSPVSVLVGVSRLKVSRFLFWDVAGEAIFVVGNLLIGRFFGVNLEEQGDLVQFFWLLALASIALPIAFRLIRRVWHSRARHPGQRGTTAELASDGAAEPALPLVQ